MTKIQFGMTVTALAITAAFLALPLLVGDAKASTTAFKTLITCQNTLVSNGDRKCIA
jgi:hypothetical protein